MKKSIIKVLSLTLIAIMMCAVLVSCGGPNADPDKAEKALKDADYEVMKIDEEDMLKFLGIDGLECVLTAGNEDEEGVVIYYFEDAAAANEAWEDIEKEAKEAMEENEDIVCKKSGKMIYYGTKEAINAAK